MKRTELKRKTPLKRSSTPMRRVALKSSGAQLKRTALKPMSDDRKILNAQRKVIMEAHFGPRSTWQCALKNDVLARSVLGPCYGPRNGHERLNRNRAGRTNANLLDVSNMIILCNRHNEQCENMPREAHALGLVVHAWEVNQSASLIN